MRGRITPRVPLNNRYLKGTPQRRMVFEGRGKAKTQLIFPACGKYRVVACALTKRVAAVGERGWRTVADEGTGHRNRGNWQTK